MKRTLEILDTLVAHDTRNPPRGIDAALFAPIRDWLQGFGFTVADHGDGCLSLLAVRGEPHRVFNVHLDTVPAAEGYTANPHKLRVTGDRAIGLGACDIKGAAAAMIAAAEASTGDVALLFTTDEEAGSSTCVRAFCTEKTPFTEVIVAEPTRCLATVEHRGIQTATAVFNGHAGHASSGRADEDSAIHHAAAWMTASIEHAGTCEGGLRFNIGAIAGGEKPNMIADSCRVRFGFRPLPGMRGGDVLDELWRGVDARHRLEIGFTGPSLPPSADVEPQHQLAAELGLKVGPAVDFWTEAALFADAGYRTLVYGPGDIAQAHTADEWVRLDELAEATQTYSRWFS